MSSLIDLHTAAALLHASGVWAPPSPVLTLIIVDDGVNTSVSLDLTFAEKRDHPCKSRLRQPQPRSTS